MSSQKQPLHIFCSKVLQCEVLTVYLEANFGIQEWKLLSFTEYNVLPIFSLPNSYKLGAGKIFATSWILDVFIMPEFLKPREYWNDPEKFPPELKKFQE